MDQAVYDSVDNKIVGIRGNRLLLIDPTTLAILSTLDVGTYARSNGCVAWDQPSNRIFAAAWNSPQYAISGGFQASVRSLYRLHVSGSSLVLDQVVDIGTAFGLAANNSAALDVGIMAMHPYGVGGNIYCRVAVRPQLGPGNAQSVRFQANPFLGSFTLGGEGIEGGLNNVVYGSIGGNDNAIMPDPEGGPEVTMFDYTASVENTLNVVGPKKVLAVGFAPVQQHVFVTDVAQFVYAYTTAGALVTTIDTTRSAFNGLVARFDATDGNVYVPGGCDGSMCVINPATNGFSIVTGLDCPVDYVRAGAVRLAVQSGSSPLKAF